MEELPDELLCVIARRVLEKEEGMKLWCKLASTCTRLWSFQLPAEPAYFLSNRLKDDGISHCCHDGVSQQNVPSPYCSRLCSELGAPTWRITQTLLQCY